MDNKICKKFFLTENGNLNRIVKKNFGLLRNSEIYCLLNGQYKFIETMFPKFIGDTVEEIIEKICLFIKKSDNFYYIFNPLEIDVTNKIRIRKLEKNENGYIINKNNLVDFFFYYSLQNTSHKNLEKKSKKEKICNYSLISEDDIVISEDDAEAMDEVMDDVEKFLINNVNLKKIKNYLIFNYISFVKKNYNPKKYKNIKNFNELYKLFDIKVISEKVNKMLKIIKKNLKEEKKIFEKEFNKIELNDIESVNKFIIKKMELKKLPNRINYYLKFVDDFYNKKYIRDEVKKILDKQKIKYKI